MRAFLCLSHTYRKIIFLFKSCTYLYLATFYLLEINYALDAYALYA